MEVIRTMIGLMVVFITLISIIEGPGLIKRKEWKEITVVSFLVLISIAYGLDYALQSHLMPDPKSLIYRLLPIAEQFSAYFNLRH